jgi:hypothetical protein
VYCIKVLKRSTRIANEFGTCLMCKEDKPERGIMKQILLENTYAGVSVLRNGNREVCLYQSLSTGRYHRVLGARMDDNLKIFKE